MCLYCPRNENLRRSHPFIEVGEVISSEIEKGVDEDTLKKKRFSNSVKKSKIGNH